MPPTGRHGGMAKELGLSRSSVQRIWHTFELQPHRTDTFKISNATPTYSSWMNLIEIWFAELTEKWIRRGTHRSVRELETSIREWIAIWNQEPRPFIWTTTADEIFASLGSYLQRISGTGD